MPPNPARLRARAIVGAAVVLVLVVAGYGVYDHFRAVTPPPPPPGCQAGIGVQAISLDPDQAAIAATIAGVAVRRKLPKQAVIIAYAAALQESKMQNLDYGDRNSVGVFQQRPSQGWGPATDLEDPVYATTKFFAALVRVPGYTRMPVDQAAQDVQHSGDGSAYEQWAAVAAQLAGYFTGTSPHGVSCWYVPPATANLAGVTRNLDADVRAAGAKRRCGEDHDGPFGPKERGKRRGRAGPAGRGLDGGRLAGRERAGVRPQRSALCRL